MREPRLSQPEYIYIFSTENNVHYGELAVDLEDSVVKALKSRKMGLPLALVSGWKFHCGRYGLSPFVLHWLTKSEKPIEKFYQELIENTYLDLFYCCTTHLPVMRSNIYWKWKPSIFYMGSSSRPENENKEKAIKAFSLVHPLYSAAKYNGLLNDEYMRKFNGSTISRADWIYLKGIVGIYE